MASFRLPLSVCALEESGRSWRIRWYDDRVSWEPTQRFPIDPASLSRDRWEDFFIKYQLSSSVSDNYAIQAPAQGKVRILRKGLKYLLVYMPFESNEIGFRSGGWFGPHANAIVFGHADLAPETVRRQFVCDWITQNLILERYHLTYTTDASGSQINNIFGDDMGDFVSGFLTFTELSASSRVREEANNWLNDWLSDVEILRRGPGIYVAAGDILFFSSDPLFSIAYVHIPVVGEDYAFHQPWYWFDAHEVISRQYEDFYFPDFVRPFEPERHRPNLAVWYEGGVSTRVNRIIEIAYGDDMHLYNPPSAPTTIPREVLFQHADTVLQVSTGNAGTVWDVEWMETTGETITSGTPTPLEGRDPLTDEPVTGSGPFDPVTAPFRWTERSDPIHVKITARFGRGESDTVQYEVIPDRIEAAKKIAREVMELVASLYQWLDNTYLPDEVITASYADRHRWIKYFDGLDLATKQEMIIDLTRIHRGRDEATRLEDFLRTRSGDAETDRREQIRRPFRSRTALIEAKQRELIGLFDNLLFEQMDRDANGYSVASMDKIIEGLLTAPLGEQFFYEQFLGFVDPSGVPGRGPDAPTPLYSWENYKALWGRLRSGRSHLAKILHSFVMADTFYREIVLGQWLFEDSMTRIIRRGGSAEMARRMTRSFRDILTRKIGQLQDIRIEIDNSDPKGAKVNIELISPNDPFDVQLPRSGARYSMVVVQTLSGIFNQLAVIYDAIQVAQNPSARNYYNLTDSLRQSIVGGVDTAIKLRQVTGVQSARLDRFAGIWGRVTPGIGIAMSGISTYYQWQDYRYALERGHDEQAAALIVSVAATVALLQLEVLPLVGAEAPPLVPYVGVGLAIIGTIATFVALEFETTEYMDAFSHSVFGEDYLNLAPPAGVEPHERDDMPFLGSSNIRTDWWGSMKLQIAHHDSYLLPFEAEFFKTMVGGRVDLTIRASAPWLRWDAEIWVQYWYEGRPPADRLVRTFVLGLREEPTYSITIPRALGGIARIRTSQVEEKITVEIALWGDPTSNPSHDVDRAALAISPMSVLPSDLPRENSVPAMRASLESKKAFSMKFLELDDRT